MTEPTNRPFNFWPWLPVVVIGAAVITNVAIILVAQRVSPQKVEEQAYAASAHFDADKAEAEAFAAHGLRLTVTAPDPTTLLLNISGGANGAGEVRLYRPDAPAADRTVVWADVAHSLTIPLDRQGVWRLDLRLHANDGAQIAARTVIDSLGGRQP